MSKDINIHLKTKGAESTKQELDRVGQSAGKLGDTVESTGRKTSRASDWIIGSLKKIAGPAGFIALGTAVAAAAGKIAKFFDDIKARSDEAVRNVQAIRATYSSLFEALDAFDEKSRQTATKATNLLLQKTGVAQELGLPVINAYTRQFKGMVDTGQITQQQYQQGLEGMLGWSARHGGAATTELISIMRGWNMVTPQQQGEFRRIISKGAQLSGLTDEEVVGALGRSMPTIKAMDWTPEQAVANIALLASGETGRKKMSLPMTTLDALMAPQLSDIEKLGIPEDVTKDPQKLLAFLSAKQSTMDRQEYLQLLTKIYGRDAATGVYKLVTTPHRGISGALKEAVGPEGAAAERAEEEARKTTLESRDAVTQAAKRDIELDITEQESFMEDVREIGAEKQKLLKRKEPVRQWLREKIQPTELEKEYAAFRRWEELLTPEEKQQILEERAKVIEKEGIDKHIAPTPLHWKWWRMTPQEKWEGLIRIQPESPFPARPESTSSVGIGEPNAAGPVTINYNNQQVRNFFPTVGVSKADLGIGARAPRGLE